MKYWLFKTEPDTYSIDDLMKEKTTEWYGIRNYQVRNMLRDDMSPGDQVLIYHSSTKSIGIVGTAKVTSRAYPDTKQFQKKSPYFDAKSQKEKPTWITRDITFVEKFKYLLSLTNLKKEKKLVGMRILQKGNRLSITPVTKIEYEYILTLAS
jgi:predicted RNA-binding protein with PUA-like domain